MKLEKNRIHLFILLFAVSSLLVHVPSNAYAAADTWTDATTTNVSATTMRGVSMSDANNGVAVGSGGTIVYTSDGGDTWTDATTTNVGGTNMYAVSMSDASNGVAVGDSGKIVYTSDGGDTWTAATTTNVGGTTMRGVSMSDANNGVAVGHSGQIVFAVSASSEDSATGEEKESSSDECYDCEAPKLTKVEVHVSSSPFDYVWHFDQKSPYPMFDDDITPIVADPGDEVEIILELTDNRTLERIADSGTYTNFLTKPNDMNNFYSNNFDKYGKGSTTFYEWHNTGEDLFYDYDQTVQWSPADIVIDESAEYVEGGQAPNLDGLVGTSVSYTHLTLPTKA